MAIERRRELPERDLRVSWSEVLSPYKHWPLPLGNPQTSGGVVVNTANVSVCDIHRVF
jgi:hypothetical protein